MAKGFDVWWTPPGPEDVRKVRGKTVAEWAALPGDGIIGAVLHQDMVASNGVRYRTVLGGGFGRMNHYFFIIARQGEWTLKDMSAFTEGEVLERYPEAQHFKRGIWVMDSVYQEVDAEMMLTRWDAAEPSPLQEILVQIGS